MSPLPKKSLVSKMPKNGVVPRSWPPTFFPMITVVSITAGFIGRATWNGRNGRAVCAGTTDCVGSADCRDNTMTITPIAGRIPNTSPILASRVMTGAQVVHDLPRLRPMRPAIGVTVLLIVTILTSKGDFPCVTIITRLTFLAIVPILSKSWVLSQLTKRGIAPDCTVYPHCGRQRGL